MPSSQANRVNLHSSKATPLESKETGKTRRFHALCGAILAYLACVVGSYLGIWDLVPLLRNEALTGPVFLLLGAGLGARRLPLVLAFSSAMVLLLLIVAHTPLAARMAAPLRMQASHAEITRGADVVMVLGSWVQSDGALTPASMARLMRGMELVRQKRAPVLVVSEIAPPAGSYVQSARKLASGLNIPLAVQPLTGRIVNTRDEAALFVALARRKGWKRVFLVTSPTHTRRATLMFRRAAQEAQKQKLQVLPIQAMELDADLARLTAPGERINVFKMALREWAGLWIYQRRGWV
jgi:uncharacterized SAM-binding protein YcdF (DUF218 family)